MNIIKSNNNDFDKLIYNIIDVIEDNSVVAVTSTVNDNDSLKSACQKIIEKLASLDKRVVLVDNTDSLEQLKQQNDAVFVFTPCISANPSSITQIKKCDTTILIEKLGTTLYKDFEMALYNLRQQNIKIAGVITRN